MKNIFKVIMSLVLIVSVNSCSNSNNVIDEVLEYETGAVLRTIEVISNTLNSSDPSSMFAVTVEEQDGEDGGLFAAVNVHVTLRDLTPGNGTSVANDVLVKSIPASEFTPGPHGLPRGTVSVTYGEAFSATGLSASDIEPGDLFVFVLKLELTDGRVYDDTNAGGSITGGFFASPFRYNALILCSPQPGVYQVDMHDSYGDGWQTNGGSGGDGIHINLVDGSGNESTIVVGMCSPYGGGAGTEMDPALGLCTGPASLSFYDATAYPEIPVGTVEATWNFPGDAYGEISFEVYGPGGEALFAGGVGETGPGLLPITLCL